MKRVLYFLFLVILPLSSAVAQDTLKQSMLSTANAKGKWKHYEAKDGKVLSMGQKIMLGEVEGDDYEYMYTLVNLTTVKDVPTSLAGKILVIERFNVSTKNGETYITVGALDPANRQMYMIKYERAAAAGEVVEPVEPEESGKGKKKKKKKQKK